MNANHDDDAATTLERLSARILPSSTFVTDNYDVDILRLVGTNAEFKTLCEKLATIMMDGPWQLRSMIVNSLILAEDASLGGTTIDYAVAAEYERKRRQ